MPPPSSSDRPSTSLLLELNSHPLHTALASGVLTYERIERLIPKPSSLIQPQPHPEAEAYDYVDATARAGAGAGAQQATRFGEGRRDEESAAAGGPWDAWAQGPPPPQVQWGAHPQLLMQELLYLHILNSCLVLNNDTL